MTLLKVPDMHCEKCVERITNALTKAKISFQVSLEDKSVTIDGDEACVQTAIEELDEIGFEASK